MSEDYAIAWKPDCTAKTKKELWYSPVSDQLFRMDRVADGFIYLYQHILVYMTTDYVWDNYPELRGFVYIGEFD